MAPAFHQDLNPRLWQNNDLRPEVRVRLMRAAIAFYQFLDLPGLRIEDIVLTGSNAAFTYTPESDCDLHLIVDHANTRCPDMAAGYFDTKRLLWNQIHDASIRGHPVELYVEDREQPAYASGVYSILRGEWIKEPKRGAPPRMDDAAITRKVASLRAEAESVLASSDPRQDEVDALLSRLSAMRRSGLATAGEFSVENIAYKLLRAEGVLDRLRQARIDAEDRDLSLNESRQINGVHIWDDPTFSQLVGLVRRFAEMKGHLLGPIDKLAVWDARYLTHYDVVSDTEELDDEWDLLPGFSYSFTAEGVDATSEWADGPFIEGNGLRLYYNGEASLEHPAIKRLLARMRAAGKPIINETIRPPVTYEQVVTPEWITEVLDYGFDVGAAHPEASADYQGDHARYDHQSVVRMLHELQDDGVIPEDVDISDPHEARPYLEEWFKDRYAYVLRNIEATQTANGYVVHRAIAVPETRARMMSGDNSPLGTFWSFSHGEVFWGDAEQGELHMQAVVAANHIDWITTIRRNMNYVIGEDELEVFLPAGTPVTLMAMKHDGHDIRVLNPSRVA